MRFRLCMKDVVPPEREIDRYDLGPRNRIALHHSDDESTEELAFPFRRVRCIKSNPRAEEASRLRT